MSTVIDDANIYCYNISIKFVAAFDFFVFRLIKAKKKLTAMARKIFLNEVNV